MPVSLLNVETFKFSLIQTRRYGIITLIHKRSLAFFVCGSVWTMYFLFREDSRVKRAAILALVFLMAIAVCGCSSSDYKKAMALLEQGQYEEAQAVFEQLDDYKDSKEQISNCRQRKAQTLIDAIGNVSLNSEAQSFFNGLDEKEKSAVENRAVLEKAINDYLLLSIKDQADAAAKEKIEATYTRGTYTGCDVSKINCITDAFIENGSVKGIVYGTFRVAVPYVTGADKEFRYALEGQTNGLKASVSLSPYKDENMSIEDRISEDCIDRANREMKEIVSLSNSSLTSVKLYYLETASAKVKYNSSTGKYACEVTAKYTMVIKEAKEHQWYFYYVGQADENKITKEESHNGTEKDEVFWKDK